MLKIPIDILIVDDERDFVDMLFLRLEDAGHRVRAANDGDAGLAAVDQAEPDVVILDIRMPGKDGITVLKLLKARHRKAEHEERIRRAEARALIRSSGDI
jgi:DNA-binding response OmpR family regulator